MTVVSAVVAFNRIYSNCEILQTLHDVRYILQCYDDIWVQGDLAVVV